MTSKDIHMRSIRSSKTEVQDSTP